MKKELKRIKNKITGMHEGIWGDVSCIRGNVTGISGDVSGIRGNIDNCRITKAERESGIDIDDLIGGGEK